MALSKKVVKGTGFVAISSYLSSAIGLVTGIILARLLLPEYFGTIALAQFFLSLLGRVKAFGFDQALIYRQDQLEKAIPTHFILQTSLGVLTFIIALVASPFLSCYYNPQMVLIFLIFAFFSIFESISSTSRVLLDKDLKFKKASIVNILSVIISSITVLSLAALGYSIWSLVAQFVTITLIRSIGFWVVSPWKPSLRLDFDKEIVKWVFKFGGILWIGAFVTFIVLQFDDFLVGTLIGTTALGFYSKAYNLSKLPLETITHVVSRVSFPTYSKLQNNRNGLSRSYTMVLSGILRLTIPMAIILFFVAPEFTVLLIGEKWLPMVPIFHIMIIYSLLRPIFDDSGALCTAIGKPDIPTKIITVQAIWVILSAPVLTYYYSVNGAAISVDIAMLIGIVIMYRRYLPKYIDIPFKTVFVPPIVSIGVALLIYLLLSQYIMPSNMILVALYKTGIIGLVYLGILFFMEKERLLREIMYVYKLLKS